MYFAVMKLTFDDDARTSDDHKELRALAEKIRARFKACAAACEDEAGGGTGALAVTALASTEERLTQTLDAITDFCETSGYGRVASEQALLDHIDALAEFGEDEGDDDETTH